VEKQVENYPDTIRFLYGLTKFGMKLGLDNTRALAELAGNPQSKLRIIHVAGTNGKGTTCAMLESIYRAAGIRAGLFTSPHLVSFRERIQVDREPIGEADVVRLVSGMRAELDDADLSPTFFEFVTVLALRWFAEQQCDLVILETGMGGRFDSTNIVEPIASVITPIAMDHQEYLGDTLARIAFEKAGIIKPGIPVFVSDQIEEAMDVIENRAGELNATIHRVSEESREFITSEPECFGHLRSNARLAVEVAKGLDSEIPVEEREIRRGIMGHEWPGRLQEIERHGCRFLIDGAHNEAGFSALVGALAELKFVRPVLVFGMLGDKKLGEIPGLIVESFSAVRIVRVTSSRAGDGVKLKSELLSANPDFGVTEHESLQEALSFGDVPEFVIAGSLYLVGEALELLDAIPAGLRSERELNEWGR